MVQTLFKQGAVIHEDNNLLLTAVDYKRYEVIKILLRQNIDINQGNKEGQTALMYAVQNGDADIVRIFNNCWCQYLSKRQYWAHSESVCKQIKAK